MDWEPPRSIDFSPENRTRVSGPVLRTFLNIARVWNLDEEGHRQLLGKPQEGEFKLWREAAENHQALTLSMDVLLRISAVLGIYKSLRIIHQSEEEGREWLGRANRGAPFDGRSPMELMLSGFEPGLMDVRAYLLAQEQWPSAAPNEVDKNFKPYTDADIVWN
jgi:hypothetical protein